MSASFEQLDRRDTPLGALSARRRLHPQLGIDVYEVILNDEHLMSSLFTAAEIALGHLGVAAATGTDLDIVVGGLGLGYTAGAVLEDERVRSVHVIEALDTVIDWHREGIFPLSPPLASDDRCHLVSGDFFALVANGSGFGGGVPPLCHGILVDIDHTPHHHLHPSHAPFYEISGLDVLAGLLHPGGVYALWSDDPPDSAYVAVVERVFGNCTAHDVTFPNPLTGGAASNTVYVATK